MPVELRKRKAHQQPSAAPVPKKKAPAGAKAKKPSAETAKKAEEPEKGVKKPAEADSEPAKEEEAEEKPKEAPAKVAVGDVVSLEGFGGEIKTNDGEATTLKKLVDESKAGVVLFTYPKASTPGCTKQVCFFRDSYEPLTAGGLAIYGLSADSPKANTTFKEKQKLPYSLLCDPSYSLIAAIGLKKSPSGTQRGVFVIDKDGKVLVAEAGSPIGTHDRVKKLVEETQ